MEAPYKSRQAIFADRPDVLVEGQWNVCAPTACNLPFAHAFCARIWDCDDSWFRTTTGEQNERRDFQVAPVSPRYTGLGYCGTEQEWQFGSLYSTKGAGSADTDGIPRCCIVNGGARKAAEFDLSYSKDYDSLTLANE